MRARGIDYFMKKNHLWLPCSSLPLIWSVFFVLSIIPAHATIAISDYWRMGENDPGAAPGVTATQATDGVRTHNLTYHGSATYSTNVNTISPLSTLCVNFTNNAYASNSIVTTNVDNFGIECWVNPASAAGTQIIVYNGNTDTSGWGLFINNGKYSGLFGGQAIFGTNAAPAGVWADVALVRNNGTATLYVNGVPTGITPAAPATPTGNFAIAIPPQIINGQSLTGLVDEVRVFTFTAGAFSTNNLLLMQPTYTLGTTNLLEGPEAGTDSVVLAPHPVPTAWTVTANATWLHPTVASGSGNTNVIFSYDANPGPTRAGTITVANQTLTVTQAGATYVVAPVPLTTLISTGLNQPEAVAVDGAGNVYIADTKDNAIKEWMVSNGTLSTLVSGLNGPLGVTLDGAGNVYISDSANHAFKQWTTVSHAVTTLISVGLSYPYGVAVDGAGDAYIADFGDSTLKRWPILTTVVTNLDEPRGLSIDVAGNVYIADTFNNAIKEYTFADQTVTTLVSSGLNSPFGVAVDGSGNVYIADTFDSAIKKWTVANNTVTTLYSTAPIYPYDLAVDGTGNIYIADADNNAIEELPRAFVDPTAITEGPSAGSDALPVVLPATENLLPPFAPTSDQPWLSVNGVANGIVNFSFTANPGASRTANLTVLGQAIPITQVALQFSLGTTNLLEGAGAGTDSVIVAVNSVTGSWTAQANATWLHLIASADTGSTNALFTFDANTGATRSGTITIAGQTLTVTQAGATYVAVPAQAVPLVSSGLSIPNGVAVDGAGDVYIADGGNNAIKKWSPASNAVTTLVSSGLNFPGGVAVDGVGNVYFTDENHAALKEWMAASNTVITLVSSGLEYPFGVTLDRAGNVYVADYGQDAIKEWTVGNNTLTSLVSGQVDLGGVAVDAAGNVYFDNNYSGSVVEKLTRANGLVTTVASSGLDSPYGMAVDGSGNVYIADTFNAAVKKWTAASQTVTTLDADALNHLYGVALDGAGNIYIADTDNNVISELPHAFVDGMPKTEGSAAGSDALPVVLPATENLSGPLAPFSDEPWLSIKGVANGIVSFSFAANTGSSRTGDLIVLGQAIPVTQSSGVASPVIINPLWLGNGGFQFGFTNTPGSSGSFTIWGATNLTLPFNQWQNLGQPVETSAGMYQFSDPSLPNAPAYFYRITSP